MKRFLHQEANLDKAASIEHDGVKNDNSNDVNFDQSEPPPNEEGELNKGEEEASLQLKNEKKKTSGGFASLAKRKLLKTGRK